MAVEPLAPVVVDGRLPGIDMMVGELDVTEGHLGVEGSHDEGGAEHVRVDVTQSSAPSDGAHRAMGGAPIQALPRGTAEDRSFGPFAHGQVDHPGGTRHDGDDCGLGALDHDPKGPVPSIDAQVLEVRTAGLAHPQAIEAEQDGEGSMGVVEVLCGEEEPSELGAIDAPALGAVDGRATDVLGGIGGDPPVDVGGPIGAAQRGEAPVDRRCGQPPASSAERNSPMWGLVAQRTSSPRSAAHWKKDLRS